ncbi:MAG: Hsp33 family molecular chaperone HslO [Caldilineaceae bacterium]|nr:Hsp33 family molecular chaperone HslO [Caldilineaceae bacterium]
MSDYLVRILAKEAGVRGLACVTTDLAQDGAHRHATSPTATATLAQGLTAAAMLGALIKVQQRVAIKVDARGPVGKLVAESNSYGRVRGYVANPAATLPPTTSPTDFGAAVGQHGLLTVVRDVGLKELAESIVPRQGGQLDSDLIYYFMQSEQSPTLVEIGVQMKDNGELHAAGGLLLQLLPDAEPTTLRNLAERLDDLPPIAAQFVAGDSPETILAALFRGIAYEVLETRPLAFQCTCSWAWAEQALRTLGRVDLEQLQAEGEAVVDCYFCHQQYLFGVEALETILETV